MDTKTTLLAIIGIAAVLAVGITATVQSVFAQGFSFTRGYHGNGCSGKCAGSEASPGQQAIFDTPTGGVDASHFAPGTSGCAPPGQVKPTIC